MGVAVSKNKSEQMLESVFSAKAFNQCPIVKIQLEQDVGDITIKDCDATIAIKQSAFFKDDCAMKTTIDSLTDFYVKNKQAIEEGLVPNLVNVSNTETKTTIRNQIETDVTNICTNVDVSESQHVGNIYCESGRLELPILQKFYGKTACVVDELIKRADKWESEQEQDVERSSGFLDGVKTWFRMNVTIVVAILLVFLAIVVGFYIWSNTEGGREIVKTGTELGVKGARLYAGDVTALL